MKGAMGPCGEPKAPFFRARIAGVRLTEFKFRNNQVSSSIVARSRSSKDLATDSLRKLKSVSSTRKRDPPAMLRYAGLFSGITFLFLASIAEKSSNASLTETRTFNGTGNTVLDRGATNRPLLRIATPSDYPGDMSGTTIIDPPARPNARQISNRIANQAGLVPNQRSLTDYIWQWGQFLDHDIDLTGTDPSNGTADIPIPVTNPPDPFGNNPIPFTRSNFDPNTGTPGNPRQQINEITAFIDASNVYGSDPNRARALRTDNGQGAKLATSAGDLLPFNLQGLPNAGGNDPNLFLAGDIRANEQVGLTAMHTLFVREHNRLVDKTRNLFPALSDEELYQTARKVVGAQMQIITYREFLPALLGPHGQLLDSYSGYNAAVDPTIANEVSTAAYRFGHSLLSASLPLVNNDGSPAGDIMLKNAFFRPDILVSDPKKMDQLLMGLSTEPAQEVDTRLVDAVRNFLFGDPNHGGMDLAALNIQRGRDHGLADYNSVRLAYGLSPAHNFDDITSDPNLAQALSDVYNDINNVDVWVAGLAEDHLPGASVGELFSASIVDQFQRLRDGDRFFFLSDPDLNSAEITAVIDLNKIRLADIIRENTSMSNMQSDVFTMVPEPAELILWTMGLLLLVLLRRARV